jgi:hypothetical protein
MGTYFTKITAWIKANIVIAALIGLAIIIVLFGKQLKRIFFGVRRIRHHRIKSIAPVRRRRSLPRSVSMRKMKPSYNRNGKQKKPWQVKGSEAARRHMAKIRRMR